MRAANRSRVYRCANKKVERLCRLHQQSARRRVSRLRQLRRPASRSSPRSTSWRAGSAWTRSNSGGAISFAPARPLRSASERLEHDVDYSSNGLDQCLDLVRDALQRRQRHRPRCAGRLAHRRGHGADHDPHRAATRVTSRIRGSVCATTAVTTWPSAPPSSATAPARCTASSRRRRFAPRSTASGFASPTPRTVATTPARLAAPACTWPGARPCSQPERCTKRSSGSRPVISAPANGGSRRTA